jgi:hypothetical protein
MGELYERILSDGIPPSPPRLAIGHWFESLLGEYGAGDITGAEALAIWEGITGSPASATMQTEIQDLIATVNAISAPAVPALPTNIPTAPGNNPNANTLRDYTTAVRDYATAIRDYATTYSQRAEGLALRAHKIRRIMQVLRLAEERATGYATVTELRARLGVPTR